MAFRERKGFLESGETVGDSQSSWDALCVGVVVGWERVEKKRESVLTHIGA
jgi:hypothetical protein